MTSESSGRDLSGPLPDVPTKALVRSPSLLAALAAEPENSSLTPSSRRLSTGRQVLVRLPLRTPNPVVHKWPCTTSTAIWNLRSEGKPKCTRSATCEEINYSRVVSQNIGNKSKNKQMGTN